MRALYLCSMIMTAAAGFARVPDGLADALAARSLLGPGVWARAVRIENTEGRGRHWRSGYPSTTYALVFELSGILWFYSDVDGTQSLSVTLGTAEADKLNPGPLFKAICAGFASWEWADGPGQTPGASGAQPPNNCFIECLAILRQRTALGADLHNSRLLFYYVGATPGRAGHTVLLFDCDRGLTAVDPDQPDRDIRIPAFVCADLRSIARYLRKGEVESARTLSIKDFGRPPPGPNWAALPRTGPATG